MRGVSVSSSILPLAGLTMWVLALSVLCALLAREIGGRRLRKRIRVALVGGVFFAAVVLSAAVLYRIGSGAF